MGFWRTSVVDFALDQDTEREIRAQKDWIAAEPGNARPWANLARLYRAQGRHDDALGLLLEAVRLDPEFAPGHRALAEMHAVRGDYRSAWRHARFAERAGDPSAVEQLERHEVPEEGPD